MQQAKHVLYPICGRGFNNDQGIKRHMRVSHKLEKKEKKA